MKKYISLVLLVSFVTLAFSIIAKVKADDNNGNSDNENQPMMAPLQVGQSQGQMMPFFRGEDNQGRGFDFGEDQNMPSGLTINPRGNVRISDASVNSVSGSSLGVSIFGLNFTINTSSSTQVMGMQSQAVSLSQINSGDIVDVMGNVAGGVITAAAVRDRNINAPQNRPQLSQDQLNQFIQMILQMVQRITGRSVVLPPIPVPTSTNQ